MIGRNVSRNLNNSLVRRARMGLPEQKRSKDFMEKVSPVSKAPKVLRTGMPKMMKKVRMVGRSKMLRGKII